MPLVRLPWTVDAKAVPLAGADGGEIAVEDEGRGLGKVDVGLLTVRVEETELDAVSDFGKGREIGAYPVPRRAEGVGPAGPDAHGARFRKARARGTVHP